MVFVIIKVIMLSYFTKISKQSHVYTFLPILVYTLCGKKLKA